MTPFRIQTCIIAVLLLGLPVIAKCANCDSTSKSLIPLTELTGTYLGEDGGLYGGNSNTAPAFHDSQGLALANAYVAMDTLGNPIPAGSWVLLSVGMSNCTQEFSRFIQDLTGDTTLHQNLRIVDGAQGGQTAARIKYDTATFWTVVENRLRSQHLSPLQVQAVWLKEANAGPTQAFPTHANILRNDLRDVIRTLHLKYPNLRQVFMSTRTYGGYASTTLNPEPYAYESGFSVRWVIQSQIDGNDSLNYLADSGAVNAPWLAWGPYLWADGIIPREFDSLQWLCADFVDDGTHPSTSGRAKVSNLLETFFKTSTYTAPWFLKSVPVDCLCECHGDPGACDGVQDILDVIEMIDVAFRGALPAPDPNPACPYTPTDLDCTGHTEATDVVRMINVAFRGADPLIEFCNPCP